MQTVQEFVFAPVPRDHWNLLSVVKETNKHMHVQGPTPDAPGLPSVSWFGEAKESIFFLSIYSSFFHPLCVAEVP